MIPGELKIKEGNILYNEGKDAITLEVVSTNRVSLSFL